MDVAVFVAGFSTAKESSNELKVFYRKVNMRYSLSKELIQ